ncbi:hypothetical protein SMACR_02610 [Sordaria macrospora]|uniref:N-acetyltransferase domain-containing protein n=1 Tax=Sordaria macrospora TaxID=5147 RepID=A0A8S9A2T7_SORMA|nr:hypothetical protein SMACR_02610 [Sordaria macrospora]WPJ60562.1 hypothetical protein SMAC4_02610 [Sordaria macrospora]
MFLPITSGWKIRNKAIQAATASEPLTLEEEYENQQSWRSSHDKLTFIICQPVTSVVTSTSTSTAPVTPVTTSEDSAPPASVQAVKAGKVDSPSQMIGDVNLFLYPNDDEEDDDENDCFQCIAEVDIMIASPSHRGKGLGKAVVSAFLQYIARNLEGVLREYYVGEMQQEEQQQQAGTSTKKPRLRMLMAKINKDNSQSIALFKSLGFEQEGEVNYFGEVKMIWRDLGGVAGINVPEGYREVVYERGE